MWRIIRKLSRLTAVVFLSTALFLAGFPSSVLLEHLNQVAKTIKDRNVVDSLYLASKDSNVIDKGLTELLKPQVENAKAATFQIQTGYYIGNGGAKSISGLGFKPEMVLLKPNSTAGAGAVWKSKAMPALNSPYFVATADTATGQILLDSDGFTVNTANTDTANIGHTWVAFAGSDCSASGTFCVGTYIGNATSPRAITTGFQPDLVWIKQSTAVAGNWRSSSMPANYGQYFAATIQDTAGALFTTLDATGFTVGATNNASAGIYYYAAFKNVTGAMSVGSFTGNGTSQSITAPNFQPDFLFMKNANAGTAVSAVYNITESYGDNTSYYTDTANVVGAITSLNATGFSVGSNSTANGSGNTIYYAAFGGAPDHTSSGTFTMARGSYTGNGAYQVISGLDFKPDLVIVKGNTTQAGVFRTRMIAGDSTAYLDAATANFAGGIISLNADGFTVGTNATVNTASTTYYWTAYGNAWNPDTNSGASDFFIGAFYGNGIDSRNITRLPFQANMVTVKRSGATAGTFRTSQNSGDQSSFFAATAEAANNVQTLSSDGFQVGTAANVNTAANYYWYFGFKNGSNFTVNTYSGTGSAQNITTAGFQPDNIWVKATAATRGVQRTGSMAADSALPFINVANLTGAITGILSNGFSVGTAAETNTSGSNNYRYMAWRIPVAGVTISGTCDAFDQSTDCGDIGTVKVAVNGSVQAQEDTSVSGTWQIDGVTVASGQVVTVWIDAAASMSDRAGAVLKYDGTGNISGVALFKEHLAIGSDDNQTITNTDVGQYDNSVASGDDDVFWDTSAGNDLVVDYESQSGQEELYVADGNTFQPASGGGADVTTFSAEIADTATSGVGTWTADSNTINIAGDFTVSSSAVFTAGSSTLTFNGTNAQTFTTGAETYNIVALNNTGSDGSTDNITVSGALDVNGAFNITNGDLLLNSGNPNVNTAGDVTIGSSAFVTKGTGTWTFDGGTQALSDSTSGQDIGIVTIGPSTTTTVNTGSGVRMTSVIIGANDTLNITDDTLTLTGNGTPLVNSNIFTTANSTVVYAGTSATNIATTPYNNLTLTPASGTPTFSLTGHLTSGNSIGGNLTISSGATLDTTGSNFNIALGGNWSNGGSFTSNSSTVTFSAGGTGRTIATGGTGSNQDFYAAIFNNGAGGWTIQTNNMKVNNNLTITDVSSWTLESGRTLEVNGVYSIADGETVATTWTGSTLYLDSGTTYIVGSKNQSAETYGTLQVGANTDIRMWNSTASTFTVDSSGSLYSQDHANVNGDLYIWGDYNVPNAATDYWNYADDFDSTDLSGGSERQVDVRVDPAATVTVGSGEGLEAIGTSSNRTTVDRQGASNGYGLVCAGGTINFQYADFDRMDGNKGLDVQTGCSVPASSLNYTKFGNLVGSGGSDDAFVTVASAVIGSATKTITGAEFNNTGSPDFNVNRSGSDDTGYWDFDATAGDYDSEAYDGDDGVNEANPGMLRWDDSITNLNPDTPTNLGPAGYVDAAGWMNDNTPTFSFDIADPDTGEQVKYRIQIDDTAGFGSPVLDYQPSSFSAEGTYNYTVGQAGSYAVGSESMTLSDSTSGSGYYWRVKAIDDDLAESAYEEAGTDSTIDFRVDATAPTGGTVYDGTSGDQDWNNGSLTQLSGNWLNFNSDTSGLQKYEYALRRKPDDYYWSVCSGSGSWQSGANWCDNGTGTSVTQNNLNLETGATYYVSVRATDNANSAATPVDSNGQQVSPSISFLLSSNSITFDPLNDTNGWSDSKNLTITTSTNAGSGYTAKSYATQAFQSLAYPAETIPDFAGTWATPLTWSGYGFGYTSSDSSVQGSDRFGSGTKYAKFTQTVPGEIPADHTDAVNGSTGEVSNEQFTITYKVAVPQTQTASDYRTYIIYITTANY